MISSANCIAIFFLVVAINAVATNNLWPRPINMTVDKSLNVKVANPCEIKYEI